MRLDFDPRSIFCVMINAKLRPDCVLGSRWLISLWSFVSGRVIAWLPCTKVVSASSSDLVCPAFVMAVLKYFRLFSRMPTNDSSLSAAPSQVHLQCQGSAFGNLGVPA